MVQPADMVQDTVHIQIIAHTEEDMVHHIVVMAHHIRHILRIIDMAMAHMVHMVHMVHMGHMDHHIIGLDMEE